MKTLTTLLILLSGLFIMLFTNAFTEIDSNDVEISEDAFTFVLSGSVYSGYPELSWNSVSGADHYSINRMPVPATGYSWNSFQVSTTGYIDSAVGVVEQTGGLCQIRYTVSAYDDDETLLATSNPIDFITTPNDVVFQTGECYDP